MEEALTELQGQRFVNSCAAVSLCSSFVLPGGLQFLSAMAEISGVAPAVAAATGTTGSSSSAQPVERIAFANQALSPRKDSAVLGEFANLGVASLVHFQ